MSDFSTVRLGGLDFAALSESAVVKQVRAALAGGVGGRIATPNVDILRQAEHDPHVRANLRRADLLVADGTPLVWASRLAGAPLPGRVTGSGLIWALSGGLAADRRSVFLLGGSPRSSPRGAGAPRAARVLSQRYPGLRVAGCVSPRFGFERDARVLEDLLAAVVRAAPDVVFVGLGFPKQERLIEMLRPVLPATWFLGCGAAINFVAGDQERAPQWMQRTGLEWLHRLLSEPRRLARRYLKHDLPFAFRLLTGAVLGREGDVQFVAAPARVGEPALRGIDVEIRNVEVRNVGRHAAPGTAPAGRVWVGRHRAGPRPYPRRYPRLMVL